MEKNALNFFFFLYLFSNVILFFLRVESDDWWFADYSIYENTDFLTNLRAFLSFVLYLSIYYFIIYYFILKIKTRSVKKRPCPRVFLFVIFLHLAQIYLALGDGVGVAGGVGQAPVWALVFLLFSADGVYYAYALTESSRRRLMFATAMFFLSNIVRGWAGFIVYFAFLMLLRRNGGVKKSTVMLMAVAGLFLLPILLLIREYFRGGYSYFDLLRDSGYSGIDLWVEYINIIPKILLSRLDLYSHYIGIKDNFTNGLNDDICNPIMENVFVKIFTYPFGGYSCKPLGGVLPGMLYDFFLDKGTSYSVSSGFLALPLVDLIYYFIPYLFVLIFSCVIFMMKIKIKEYSAFFICLLLILLFQGWMYQFIHNALGYLIGILLVKRISFKSNDCFNYTLGRNLLK